jgi:ferrous iron transport protein B
MSQLTNRDKIISTANKLRWELGDNLYDALMETIYENASEISSKVIIYSDKKPPFNLDRYLDKILTSKYFGIPIMFLMLFIVFWLTISGANYPSSLLSLFLVDKVHPFLREVLLSLNFPKWFVGVFIDGAYLSTAWVVSVMLPPMAIFFPLFTLLEDFGYLPRVAFNLDSIYKKAGAHGKQALTMAMGFGCNAAGVISTRIIDSPRERLLAIITNNFSLCNGRWPTQILIATIFIGTLVPPYLAGIFSAGAVIFVAILGIALSLIVSFFLSKTLLKGEVSTFSLELPPYRPPRIMQTIYTSLINKTIFVLWRAIVFAFPAGIVIWTISNITIQDNSIANHIISMLNPLGLFLGLNGVILLAYIIAIPANELIIPTILMLTVSYLGMNEFSAGSGVLFELESVEDISNILRANGWTLLTGINLMLFSLLHNPCSTTIFTIFKETKSLKWTVISTFLPIIIGLSLTFLITRIWSLFN